MPSLLANVANGTCPENCKCAVLFMDAIVQRTLKFVAFNGKDEPDSVTEANQEHEIALLTKRTTGKAGVPPEA